MFANFALFLALFQKFRQGELFILVKILLHIRSIYGINFTAGSFGAKALQIAFTTSKTVFRSKLMRKTASNCKKIQKFGQHSFAHVIQMLLCNQRGLGINLMALNPRNPNPKRACTICMLFALPKRIQAGQSENEFSPGFKTKNYS